MTILFGMPCTPVLVLPNMRLPILMFFLSSQCLLLLLELALVNSEYKVHFYWLSFSLRSWPHSHYLGNFSVFSNTYFSFLDFVQLLLLGRVLVQDHLVISCQSRNPGYLFKIKLVSVGECNGILCVDFFIQKIHWILLLILIICFLFFRMDNHDT